MRNKAMKTYTNNSVDQEIWFDVEETENQAGDEELMITLVVSKTFKISRQTFFDLMVHNQYNICETFSLN